jgi:hypothetical protein
MRRNNHETKKFMDSSAALLGALVNVAAPPPVADGKSRITSSPPASLSSGDWTTIQELIC